MKFRIGYWKGFYRMSRMRKIDRMSWMGWAGFEKCLFFTTEDKETQRELFVYWKGISIQMQPILPIQLIL